MQRDLFPDVHIDSQPLFLVFTLLSILISGRPMIKPICTLHTLYNSSHIDYSCNMGPSASKRFASVYFFDFNLSSIFFGMTKSGIEDTTRISLVKDVIMINGWWSRISSSFLMISNFIIFVSTLPKRPALPWPVGKILEFSATWINTRAKAVCSFCGMKAISLGIRALIFLPELLPTIFQKTP